MANKNYGVFVEGLVGLDELDQLDETIEKNLVLTINDTLREGRKLAAREMEDQVNFPRGYLTGDNGRLSIEKFATGGNMLGILRGRDRPTSLARFVKGGASVKGSRRGGVNVSVSPGIVKPFKTAFLMQLKAGNLGLAIRTKDKKAPTAAFKPKEIAPGLWLLYGPSVDQVFNETREMIKPVLEEHMRDKFSELMERS